MNRRHFLALCAILGACPRARANTQKPPPPNEVVFEWRDMLREELRLRTVPLTPEIKKAFPEFSPEMMRLGEAFAKTAYPANIPLGRKNFFTLVCNLGMERPIERDLRQFLHPNKKPWAEYTGPTDGNCQMLFNHGTLNLDKSDGSTKDHPARQLAKKHFSFWTSQAHVKALSQTLRTCIRAEHADTAILCGNAAKRAAFMLRFRALWDKKFPKEKLSDGDTAFVEAMLRYTA